MRSSKSRSRNKSNRQRSLGNIVNRVFDSSGPEGKVRGTPQQIIEKYLTLARDAQLSNDRVAEQSFFQHAEHYTRMLGEAQREQAERQAQHQQNQGGQQHGHRQNGDDEQGDQRDTRDQRDNRDGRDNRDQRDSRDGRDHRDNRDQRDNRANGNRQDNRGEAREDREHQRETARAEAADNEAAEAPVQERREPQADNEHKGRHGLPEALLPASEAEPEADQGPVATPEDEVKPKRARKPRAEGTPRAPRGEGAPRAPRARRKPAADADTAPADTTQDEQSGQA
ncbi:DUF4167 domain-containing protein [Paracoccus sp. TK19116]|uniref:DUF4167 domain-containing protein n=1 Tax=Paracoccus albicereus TaxID=2922394 RepID=A0ABT1MQD6_9RHOB|nr:DUF4167 domain-containing protein [Paracoccus albicereus]MCQ0970530.1 DUF4167 domain-containing protein [Paracoccus albicereus]